MRDKGPAFIASLRERLRDLDAVGDIRGRGYFVGIELVADRESREPFDPDLGVHNLIRNTAMQNGLICYPVGGSLDGAAGDVAILAPPYIASDNELDEIADKFETTVRQVADDLRKN